MERTAKEKLVVPNTLDKKQKICFITAHLPSPNSKQAGQKIVYNHLLWLSEAYDILLIACANQDELASYDRKLYEFCNEIHVFPITNLSRMISVVKRLWLPFIVAFRYNKEIENLINECYTSREDIVFWFEYDQMCQYIPNRRNQLKKTFVVCHDMLVQMFERKENSRGLLRFLFGLEKKRVIHWERKCLSKCDLIITLSVKDQKILKDRYDLDNSTVLYPKIASEATLYNAFELGKERAILFFGAMNRPENEDAILWFIHHVFDNILEVYSETKLIIVGANPTEKVKSLPEKYSNVIVTGFVENPASFFKKAWFAIAPLQQGAGVKIKVLECLAFGLPVVATTIGAEGIEADRDDGLIVADDIKKYEEACLGLLESENKSICLAKGANKWFQQKYIHMQESPERVQEIIQVLKINS